MNDDPHVAQPAENEPVPGPVPGSRAARRAAKIVPSGNVERLFPFILRTRGLLVGRDTLRANKSKLHFVLITEDIAESSKAEVLADFKHYPIVQHFTGLDLEQHFKIKGARAVGFVKSGLAQSIYAELKPFRINEPVIKPKPPAVQPPAAASSDLPST
jgi:hypothetical protein